MDEIKAFEATYGVLLPADLRAYFLSVNGMEDGVFDENITVFLPLHEVKSAPEFFSGWPEYERAMEHVEDATRYFVIVNCIICSYFYVIYLPSEQHQESPVFFASDFEFSEFARSFTEFIKKYIKNIHNN